MVQKIMCVGDEACECFLKIFPSWEFCVVDDEGLSQGFLVILNSIIISLKPFLAYVGTTLEGRIKGLE